MSSKMKQAKREHSRTLSANVVIVGAGPAGLGVARVLRDLAIPDVRILERECVGASFRRWSLDMHFISPSFTGNAFGLTDLNAISFDSSPAFALKREHLSGADYASYLDQAVEIFGLNVATGIDVKGIEPDGEEIVLHTNRGEIRARFVIWAAGQFQYPDTGDIRSAEHGTHSSRVRRWTDYPGNEAIVVGGYESGIDAAVGLAASGKRVTVLSRSETWERNDADPSLTLSPYTRERLEMARRTQLIQLVGDADILGLQRTNGATHVLAADGRSWSTHSIPILATGFAGSTSLIDDWFDFDNDGCPIVTAQDESTRLPGLFLVGPELKHRGHLFCFIYKFRQRFAVVARAIAGRLGADTDPLEAYRTNNMFLDDLSCCDIENCRC
ncbi:NAD(P)/FAD-dependent oxidoreductase [Brucella intermedia]|uniref:NAD(P)/FAD-dependent oxidoreductase n=1 Tax=Brucella intermedia TaxID=94625 RepID=UPI002248D06A|nr:NAD(P)/FAD-dependent oxidoreductase [Brucella intermedia]